MKLGAMHVLAAVVGLTACASIPEQAKAQAVGKAAVDVRNTAVKVQEQLRPGLLP